MRTYMMERMRNKGNKLQAVGTEDFGIPFDRHVWLTAGLNQKTLKHKQWIQGTFQYCLGKFLVKAVFNFLKSVAKNFNCKKKMRHVCLKHIETVENIFLDTSTGKTSPENRNHLQFSNKTKSYSWGGCVVHIVKKTLPTVR